MNKYDMHFHTAIHAHFVAMIIPLYRMYETRGDTFNIPRFVDRLFDDDVISQTDHDELIGDFQNIIKPHWIKISIIRNEALGHHAINQTMEAVFKRADAKNVIFEEIISYTKDILVRLAQILSYSNFCFDCNSRSDTLKLLKDLKKLNEL